MLGTCNRRSATLLARRLSQQRPSATAVSTLALKASVARQQHALGAPHYCNCRWQTATTQKKRHYTGRTGKRKNAVDIYGDDLDDPMSVSASDQKFQIPQRIQQKVISAADAVSLVRDGDTITASGFVGNGCAEAVVRALGERYNETGHPNSLTLLFGGGPGDWDKKGLNHVGKIQSEGNPDAPPMLRRTIGGHYGQTPEIAKMVLQEIVEAWSIPMGSVSRMIRAQSTHSPGHITNIGIGTYIDPDENGGTINEKARNSPFKDELISKIDIGGSTHLVYKALPIDVAIIRGTTADAHGNISIEDEAVNCDQMITAAAARNSGGLVIAQVKRLAADGSLPSRMVEVPGPMVDCVVVVDQEDHDELHPMSYMDKYNPVLTGAIRAPQDQMPKMELNTRKLIARRAAFGLRPNTVTNLGIGLPEGVALVASEESILEFVTLTTEPGIFGGLPASGHRFGPAYNANAVIEMNKMFDFYDGGGLDVCFLGAAEVSQNGDVNVSRVSQERLTGPGGFVDISQPTKNVYFLTPFTTGGLKVGMPGDGTLKIEEEGTIKKFVPKVREKTFSGDEAVRRGQSVYYVTERAVFRRSALHDVLELVEIAPGLDLQKDILDQMSFEPAVSENLALMDERIFNPERMNIKPEFFGNIAERYTYHEKEHTIFLELGGVTIDNSDDIQWFCRSWADIVVPIVQRNGPVHAVINYEGFDIRKGLEDEYSSAIENLVNGTPKLFESITRFSNQAFKRAQLGHRLHLEDGNIDCIYNKYVGDETDGGITLEQFREILTDHYHRSISIFQLQDVADTFLANKPESEAYLNRSDFKKAVVEALKYREYDE